MMKYKMNVVSGIVLTLMLTLTFMTPSYSQNVTNAPQIQWLTHTSNNCKLTIDYPSTWTLEEKQGRFDLSISGSELKISNNNPSKANTPFIAFTNCDKFDSPADMGTLNDYTNMLQHTLLNSIDPVYQIAEYSHLERNLIGGRDAGVFALVVPPDNNVPSIGVEAYTVINGTMAYQFIYTDFADHFDSVEGKQIRDHILKSIKFLP